MTVLLSGLTALGVLAGLHIVVWRIHKRARNYQSLLILCLAVPVAFLGASYAVLKLGHPVTVLPRTGFDVLNFVSLYVALALLYVACFPPIQADSPSMTIVLRIEQSGPEGLALPELLSELNDQALVLPRVQDLLTGRLVRLERGRFLANQRGRTMAKAFASYRALLKMEKGG